MPTGATPVTARTCLCVLVDVLVCAINPDAGMCFMRGFCPRQLDRDRRDLTRAFPPSMVCSAPPAPPTSSCARPSSSSDQQDTGADNDLWDVYGIPHLSIQYIERVVVGTPCLTGTSLASQSTQMTFEKFILWDAPEVGPALCRHVFEETDRNALGSERGGLPTVYHQLHGAL